MTRNIDSRNLIAAFRDELPELDSRYEEELKFWDGARSPSIYDFVGFVFKPEFRRELESGSLSDFILRSASLLERVCESGDKEAVNVIWIKIFEWLLPQSDTLTLLWPVLEEKTRANIRDAATRWGYTLPRELGSVH